MRQAFIVQETEEYALVVYLVFADTPKEARTVLFGSGISLRNRNPKAHCEVTQPVQAKYEGVEVIELASYRE